jgi:peroxiredoxin
MKGALKVTVALLVLILALLYLFREPLKEFAYQQLTRDMFVAADQDDFDPGPAVGSSFPGLHATHEGRAVSLLTPFAGTSGTLFIASRSLDWCPFCMRQMMQLQQSKAAFDEAGIGMVAITYDAPELLRRFADQHQISIPLLSDDKALSFKTLGILNEDYQPGDSNYGIPYPGMIIVDPNGIVVGKLFVEDYTQRVDSTAALAFAKSALGISP